MKELTFLRVLDYRDLSWKSAQAFYKVIPAHHSVYSTYLQYFYQNLHSYIAIQDTLSVY